MVEVTDSEDKFEVFNKDLSPETSITDLGPHFSPIIDEMGIQHKPKSSLLELIENQPARDATGKIIRSKSPTPPPALPPPQPVDLKRKRELKGKGVMEARKTLPPSKGRGSKSIQTSQNRAEEGQKEKRSPSRAFSLAPRPNVEWGTSSCQCLHLQFLRKDNWLRCQCHGASLAAS